MPRKSIKAKAKINREAWLGCLIELLRPLFVEIGHPLPETVHVSVGFPSKAALARSKRRIGECWSGQETSADGFPHIFLHPELGEPDPRGSVRDPAVDHVLLHELVHAALREEDCGHRGAFVTCAKAVGLTGEQTNPKRQPKMTATWPTPKGAQRLAKLRRRLGPFPHSVLKPGEHVRKKGRMLKMSCLCEGGRPLRVSKTQVGLGAIRCDLCGEEFVLDGEPRAGSDEEREHTVEALREFGDEPSKREVERELEKIRSARRVEHATRVLGRLTRAERELALSVLDLIENSGADNDTRRMA